MKCFTELDRLVVSIDATKNLKKEFPSQREHFSFLYKNNSFSKLDFSDFAKEYISIYNNVNSILGLTKENLTEEQLDNFLKSLIKVKPSTKGLSFPSREFLKKSDEQDSENRNSFKEGDNVYLIKDKKGKVAFVGKLDGTYKVLAVLSQDEIENRFSAYRPMFVNSEIKNNTITIKESLESAPVAKVSTLTPTKVEYGDTISSIEESDVSSTLNSISALYDSVANIKDSIPFLRIGSNSKLDEQESFLNGRPYVQILERTDSGFRLNSFKINLNKAPLSKNSDAISLLSQFKNNIDVLTSEFGITYGTEEFNTMVKEVASTVRGSEIIDGKKKSFNSKYEQENDKLFDTILNVVRLTHGQDSKTYYATSLLDYFNSVNLSDSQLQNKKEQLKKLFNDFELTDSEVSKILELPNLLSGNVFEIVFGIKNNPSPRKPKIDIVERNGKSYSYDDMLEEFRTNIDSISTVPLSTGGYYKFNRVGESLGKQKVKGIRTERTLFKNRNTISLYNNTGNIEQSVYKPISLRNGFGPLQKALKLVADANNGAIVKTDSTKNTYVENLLTPFFTIRNGEYFVKSFFSSDISYKNNLLKGVAKTIRSISKDLIKGDIADEENLITTAYNLDENVSPDTLKELTVKFNEFHNTSLSFSSVSEYVAAELDYINRAAQTNKINIDTINQLLNDSNFENGRFKKENGSYIRANIRMAGEIGKAFEKNYFDYLSLAYQYHTNPDFKDYIDSNPNDEIGFIDDKIRNNQFIKSKIDSMSKEDVIKEFEKAVSSSIETNGVVKINESMVDVTFNTSSNKEDISDIEEPTETKPINTQSDIEVKKADIERRRQEELLKSKEKIVQSLNLSKFLSVDLSGYVNIGESLTEEERARRLSDDIEIFVENHNSESNKDYEDFLKTQGHTLFAFVYRKDFEALKQGVSLYKELKKDKVSRDKINAKYDSELAKLDNESKVESNTQTTLAFDKELAQKIQDKLQKLYPEIKLNITNTPVWEQGDNVFNQKDNINKRFESFSKLISEVFNIKIVLDNNLKTDYLLSGNSITVSPAALNKNISLFITQLIKKEVLTKEQYKSYIENEPDLNKIIFKVIENKITAKDLDKYNKDFFSDVFDFLNNIVKKIINYIDSNFSIKKSVVLKHNISNLTLEGFINTIYYNKIQFLESIQVSPKDEQYDNYDVYTTPIPEYFISDIENLFSFKEDEKDLYSYYYNNLVNDLKKLNIDKFELDYVLDIYNDNSTTRVEVEYYRPLINLNTIYKPKSLGIVKSFKDANLKIVHNLNSYNSRSRKDILNFWDRLNNNKVDVLSASVVKKGRRLHNYRKKGTANITFKDNTEIISYFPNDSYTERVGINKLVYDKSYEIYDINDAISVEKKTEDGHHAELLIRFQPQFIETFELIDTHIPDYLLKAQKKYGFALKRFEVNNKNKLELKETIEAFNTDIPVYNQLYNNQIIGQANIKAMTVLIDAVNQKQDTLPHEYAHHYIAWFRNTPIVQEAIKKWGSEEALVQSIGEQVVKQKGEAYNWWTNFVKWILVQFNKLSSLEKEELTQILTDAFLTRQDLNKITPTTETIKPELEELFESNPELANDVLEDIENCEGGYNNFI